MIFSLVENYADIWILHNLLIYKTKTCKVANFLGLVRSMDLFVTTQKAKLLLYISHGDSR